MSGHTETATRRAASGKRRGRVRLLLDTAQAGQPNPVASCNQAAHRWPRKGQSTKSTEELASPSAPPVLAVSAVFLQVSAHP